MFIMCDVDNAHETYTPGLIDNINKMWYAIVKHESNIECENIINSTVSLFCTQIHVTNALPPLTIYETNGATWVHFC